MSTSTSAVGTSGAGARPVRTKKAITATSTNSPPTMKAIAVPPPRDEGVFTVVWTFGRSSGRGSVRGGTLGSVTAIPPEVKQR
jgi:hypothetical protein